MAVIRVYGPYTILRLYEDMVYGLLLLVRLVLQVGAMI